MKKKNYAGKYQTITPSIFKYKNNKNAKDIFQENTRKSVQA